MDLKIGGIYIIPRAYDEVELFETIEDYYLRSNFISKQIYCDPTKPFLILESTFVSYFGYPNEQIIKIFASNGNIGYTKLSKNATDEFVILIEKYKC